MARAGDRFLPYRSGRIFLNMRVRVFVCSCTRVLCAHFGVCAQYYSSSGKDHLAYEVAAYGFLYRWLQPLYVCCNCNYRYYLVSFIYLFLTLIKNSIPALSRRWKCLQLGGMRCVGGWSNKFLFFCNNQFYFLGGFFLIIFEIYALSLKQAVKAIKCCLFWRVRRNEFSEFQR